MRHMLVLIPEREPGEPDWGMNGLALGPLPEGTFSLHVQAHWQVTEDDGSFEGGTAIMTFELEDQ